MTSSDWERIEAAFQEALNLSDDAREEFLAAFTLEYPNLGNRLRDLLAADAEDDDQLLAPIASSIQTLAKDTVDPWIGKALGAWTIRKRIAVGGMSAVFLGERDDRQFEQRVAIKIMSSQLLAPDAVARFKAERQILANLNHPYIAQLHDGGTTDDGLPYLVMEFVEGLPIDAHCDEHKLNIDRRLALFRKVCDAVDYAHRNLTVHRDLKPSNILIDEHGDPKLLDFGIAKLLDAKSTNVTIAMTRQGARAMTPEYASPEQVRGEPVSVATDVYSLGVLLYRLMTGQSPYGSTVSSPLEYERAIIEYDPHRPSTVITSPDGDDEEIGARRDTSARQLRNRLSGDLDNIVLKALQKDPERRYATANALATDLRRFMHNEPVEARGDDWLYKTRKFVVRNARALAITAVVLATLTSLTIYYTARLTDERDRANLAAAQASEVSSFLTSLFESASPHESKGQPITAVDLLQEGRERIEELGDQPKLQAELMRIMASSMTALGHLDRSIPILERVLEMKEAEAPQDLISISQSTHNLAEAYRQNRDLEKAEQFERRTLEIARNEFGPTDNNVAYLMARVGVIMFDARRTDEALDIEQRALEIMIANGSGESSNAIDVRGNMANALARLGRYDEAEALHRETLALSERIDGELAPNTVIRMANLCLVLIRLGKLEEAVATLETALERGDKIWPPEHDQIAFMSGTLAAALKRLGRMAESLAAYRKAAEITRATYGEDSIIYVGRLRGTASVLMDMARYDEAEAMFNEALAKAIAVEGDDQYNASLLRGFLGRLNGDRHRYAEAETLLRRALRLGAGLDSATHLILKNELANALSAQGQFDEAETLLVEVIAGQEATTGADNPAMLPPLAAAVAHHRRAGNLETSLEYGERIASITANDTEPLTWSKAMALAEYGLTLEALQRDDARAVLTRAQDILLATFGDSDPRVLELAAHTD